MTRPTYIHEYIDFVLFCFVLCIPIVVHEPEREVVPEVVKQTGSALFTHVAPKHKSDREVVPEAVKQNGYALFPHAAAKHKS